MREAQFAGYMYPESENGLRKALEEAFTGERGPGSMPQQKHVDRKVVAAIVPHAAYPYSGACAAWAYHGIGATKKPDLYILLGPNHTSSDSGTTMETWKTPLGIVRADQDFVRELVKKGNISLNDEIYRREHSIEVQPPLPAHSRRGAEDSPHHGGSRR
jgi:AmmeMemoRadiSam system protein B